MIASKVQENKRLIIGVTIFVALTLAIVLPLCSLTAIPSGYVGIVSKYGRVEGGALPPGRHWVGLESQVAKMSTQIQNRDLSELAYTQNGVQVSLELALIFELPQSAARDVYIRLGDAFVETVILPQVQKSLRDVTNQYTWNKLYNSEFRKEVHEKLKETCSDEVEKYGIIIHEILIKKLDLPDDLKNKIVQNAQEIVKEKHEKDLQELAHEKAMEKQRLDSELQEKINEKQKKIDEGLEEMEKEKKKRELIAAQSQHEANEELKRSFDGDGVEHLLKWHALEAQKQLADSANTKIVSLDKINAVHVEL